MIVPSHFVPLAAPGMVSLGLRWMLRPREPVLRPAAPEPRPAALGLALLARRERAPRRARGAAAARPAPGQPRAASRSWRASCDDIRPRRSAACSCCAGRAHGLAEEDARRRDARALGVPAECSGRDEAAALEPELRLDVAGAVHYPLDCHLAPDRLMAALRAAGRAVGRAVRVEHGGHGMARGARARGGRRGRRSGELDGGRIRARGRRLVVRRWRAASACALPMQAGKGYSLTLQRAAAPAAPSAPSSARRAWR